MDQEREFIQKEATEWAEWVTFRMMQELAKVKEVTVSRKEIMDIHNAFRVALSGEHAEIDIIFGDSGRYIDMSSITYSGGAGAEKGKEFLQELTDWVSRKGVSSFERVPGYPDRGKLGIDTDQQIERIALGIFFSRYVNSNVKGFAHKRKKWWSHILYGGLNNLYGRLMYNYGQAAAQSVGKMVAD